MWAYLPNETLRSYGLTYMPSKHWAVAVPAMIVMSYLFSIVLYKALNMMWTPTLDSYATVLGTHLGPADLSCWSWHSRGCVSDAHSVFLHENARDAYADAETPPMSDIPLTEANSILFPSPPPAAP
jgi:phosphatidylinositol N-acetylglucosaminyltransferase subunit P